MTAILSAVSALSLAMRIFKVVLKEKPEIDEENMEVAFTNLLLQVYVYNGQLMLKGAADSVAPFEATEKRIQI